MLVCTARTIAIEVHVLCRRFPADDRPCECSNSYVYFFYWLLTKQRFLAVSVSRTCYTHSSGRSHTHPSAPSRWCCTCGTSSRPAESCLWILRDANDPDRHGCWIRRCRHLTFR